MKPSRSSPTSYSREITRPARTFLRPTLARRALALAGRVLGVLFVLILIGLLAAPRVLEARWALDWTTWHAGRAARDSRAAEHVRQAGHWAARTVDAAAPLPWAADAASLALRLAQSVEGKERVAALVAYTEVRAALDRARATRGRGFGLSRLAAEARQLEEAARAKKR